MCSMVVLLPRIDQVPNAYDSVMVFRHLANSEMKRAIDGVMSHQLKNASRGAFPGVHTPSFQNLTDVLTGGPASIQEVQNQRSTPEPTAAPCTSATSNFRIRVLLVPSQFAPKFHASRVEAVRKTWGRSMLYTLKDGRCVAWEVSLANEASAYETPSQLQSVPGEATPPPAIQARGKSSAVVYNLLQQFTRVPEPDWVFKVDDCVYVIPENAIDMFDRYDADKPILLGSHLRNGVAPGGELFTSSAGYALSRGALRLIHKAETTPDTSTAAWLKSRFRRPGGLSGMPDVGISALCKQLGIDLPDTRDQVGGERFNAFPIVPSVSNAYHDWFVNYKRQAGQTPRSGPSCCAADSVLFHYVGGVEILFLDDLLRGDWFASASSDQRNKHWPQRGQVLFDTWNPRLRPDTKEGSATWVVLENLQQHLRQRFGAVAVTS